MKTLKLYETPTIECLEILVEQGFSSSNGDIKGDDLLNGGPLSFDDYDYNSDMRLDLE